MKKFKPALRNNVELEETIYVPPETLKPPKRAKKPNSDGNLPPDVYRPIVEEQFIPLDIESDNAEYELCLNVTRLGEYGLPYVDMRVAVTSESYTGKTKKGVSFPVDNLPEVIDILTAMKNELRTKRL